MNEGKGSIMMKCAFYEADITGPIGSSIPGYFADRFTTGIKDRLYAKAFAASHKVFQA